METQPTFKIPDHELLRCIGHGSYGEVWLARNTSSGTYRAVKLVCRARFEHDRPYERELDGLLKFEPVSRSHEGFVDILHVGRLEGEKGFYAVMELADDELSGQTINPGKYTPKTLRGEMRRRHRLPFEECAQIGAGLTSALEHLHEHKLVHRDIKPSNIIFVGGVPKLADIGLVTDFDATRSFVGTEGYVPPEGPGTPQADIFSLGKVLYEISTGRDRMDYPELPTGLKDFPEQRDLTELNEVVIKACDTDPRRRYSSATEMHADFRRLLGGGSVLQRRLSERRKARVKRVALGALAFLTVAAVAAWLHWKLSERPVRVEQGERHIVVRGDRDSVLWTKNFDARVNRAELLDPAGNGRERVVVATDGTKADATGKDSGKLFVFDGAKRFKWAYAAPTNAYYTNGQMVVCDFAAAPGTNLLAVNCRERGSQFPSCLVVLDGEGKQLATYWHPGHIQLMLFGSETPGSRPKIIVAAWNNRLREEYGGSSSNNITGLLLLDLDNIKGEAPPYTGGSRGTHEWYGVFLPPGGSVDRLFQVDVNGDGKNEIFVHYEATDFYISFDGKVVETRQGDAAKHAVEFRRRE